MIAALFLTPFLDAIRPHRRSLNTALHAKHLALHRRDFFHGCPDLSGEAPQHGTLEADGTDASRDPHACPMGFPEEMGMLPGLQAARYGVQLLPQLLEFSEMAGGFFGHGDKFPAALAALTALFGPRL